MVAIGAKQVGRIEPYLLGVFDDVDIVISHQRLGFFRVGF